MPTTIPAGNASTPYTITTPDTYTLAAGTTRTQTAGTGIQATVSTGATTLVVDGSLVGTASGARAIRAALKDGQLTVGPNGLVQALDADAFQAQALSGGVLSTVNLTNLGRIVSTTSITAIRPVSTTQPSGYALNYNAALGAAGAPATDFTSGGVITNGAAGVTTALIRSDSADAIRLGAHQTLVNYGTIDGNGQVNDSSANNALAGTSTAERYDSSRGVRINAATATNDRIDNYGTITAAQHAVDVGNAAATNVLVNNFAGGQLVGRNGSGVGADTTGVAAGTVVVTNAGLIRGAYAPLFDRAGLATLDGDGDGVDVDGGATVTNLAGGIIEGTGAGGNDSSGRLNNSEGISIGGGTITNSGIIRGAGFGIVVNNDSNPNGSRSGVLATQVVNNAAGSITGQGGYAIRSENRTGTAAGDDDGIVNYGRIAGNGTIPDTTQTVRLQNGAADVATVGILDGRTYTAADAGSVRFIRGDGSAVQTGEGADVLSNYGTLTGGTGRALNLEGGADTLNLYTGSVVAGRLDGGAGIDTLNLRLDDRSGANAEAGANSGAVTGTLADTVGFETLNVEGGAWTVTDAEAFVSGAFVSNGAALGVAAGATLDAAVTVASGGSLGGAGRTGAVTVAAGGLLGPGDGASGIGTLSTDGLGLASGAAFRAQIGTAADQVRVAGGVDLGGATLDLAALSGFAPSPGRRYTLVDNDGADAVAGRFADTAGRALGEGALVLLGGAALQISYAGGDGNDVVLTDITQGGGRTPVPLLITGTGASESLLGEAGDDRIAGAAGNDTVSGGAGNDLLLGNLGDDLLLGGQGRDTLYGGQGADTLYGGQGGDLAFGDIGADVVLGNLGDDTLLGNGGADTLFGGQGNDRLYGGQGDDVLSGDLGDDVLSGDLGADHYVFGTASGHDVILGFDAGQGDRIALLGQSYSFGTAADGSGSALLVLSGGGTIELAGITQGQVGAGFFA